MGRRSYTASTGVFCPSIGMGLLLAAGGEERLKGILEATRRTVPPGALLALLALALAVLMVLLVRRVILVLKERREIREKWSAFTGGLKSLSLVSAERRLAQTMAARQCPKEPGRLLKEDSCFEAAVQAHMDPHRAPEDGEDLTKTHGCVQALRKAFGFDSPSGVIYRSSRQIGLGQELYLDKSGEGGERPHGFVTDRREDYLVIGDVQPPQPNLAGSRIHTVFFVSGRSYAFETRVERCEEDGRRLFLEHVTEVKMGDRREYYRVRAPGPISIRADWEGADVRREGFLLNLGAGGACVVAPCFYEEGEVLVLELIPDRYLGQGDDEEDILPGKSITGRVIEAVRTPRERCRYHIQFHEAAVEDRRYLLKLVRRIEVARRE